jgi:peroxiredoxin (alkyl hydroperoxide reductase subunit C)
MSRLLGLGEPFPEFSLQACVSAEPGSEFRLVDANELGRGWTAIFFWPRDFTFVCPTELVEFNRALREFRALSTRVLGFSGDSRETHLAWRRENPDLRNLDFPMVADPEKELVRELGILDPVEQVPLRATYLVDQERRIRWLCVNDLSVGRNTGEVLRVLAALQCGELCPANWSPGQATLIRPQSRRKAVPWESQVRAVPARATTTARNPSGQ